VRRAASRGGAGRLYDGTMNRASCGVPPGHRHAARRPARPPPAAASTAEPIINATSDRP
jgi:hypothetical protein